MYRLKGSEGSCWVSFFGILHCVQDDGKNFYSNSNSNSKKQQQQQQEQQTATATAKSKKQKATVARIPHPIAMKPPKGWGTRLGGLLLSMK
jgi:hypothetical protein